MANSGFKANGQLWKLLDEDQDGELAEVQEAAEAEMRDIERTAKEVGGDPQRSARYNDSKAVVHHIRQLRALCSGYYTHVLSGDAK